MTAYRPVIIIIIIIYLLNKSIQRTVLNGTPFAVIGCKLKQNANEGCNSCASLGALVSCFIACFTLLVIAPLAKPVLATSYTTCTCYLLLCRIFVLISAILAGLSVVVEQDQSYNINDESGNADVDHTVHLLDGVRDGQSLDGLDEDGEAESYQEDGVDQSTEHLSTCPTVRVLRRTLLRHLMTEQQRRSTVEKLLQW